jgi:hypothetical protein
MTVCIEIFIDTAGSFVTATQVLGIFHAFGEKYGRGLSRNFELMRTSHGHVQINQFGTPPKAVIENQISFSSNSAVRLDPVKRLLTGAENVRYAGTR